jgi:hypothetical protein
MRCGLFGDPRRPACCEAFLPEPLVCGENRIEALAILERWERLSMPPPKGGGDFR